LTFPPEFRLTILIPVYNDWAAAAVLLQDLDRMCASIGLGARVLIVDDGSTEPAPDLLLSWVPQSIRIVDVLELYGNLGHQRALCCGLVKLYQENATDAVLIMDADGEDAPTDVPALLDCYLLEKQRKLVFASRARRTEGLVFKLFYQAYRTLHRLFVGVVIRIGNFSVIPFRAVAGLVRSSHLWNHYAAAAVKSRFPRTSIPIAKAKRIQGRSKMNFVSLLIHGLSALAVNTDNIAARSVVMAAMALGLGVLALAVVVFLRLGTSLAIAGWATSAAGLILLTLLQVVIIALLFSMGVLNTRAVAEVIPLRDCPFFMERVRRLEFRS
jgi:glycosyltransferase involved in cell wall biosynthesis